MRVGVLTSSYPRHADDWAGGFVAGLAHWLARGGDAVEVLAPFPAADPRPGPRLHALRYALRPRLCYGAGAPDNLLGGASAAQRVAAWAQVPTFVGRLAVSCWWHARRWDAVISHWLLPCAVVAARLARGRPHLAIAHSSDVHLLSRLPGAALWLRALVRPRSTLVLTSETLRPVLLGVARDARSRDWVARAPIVPMGIDAPSWLASAGETRGPRPPEAPLRVVFVGRLVALKGVDLLLRACAGWRCSLVVVGDGPERGALEALAAREGVAAQFLGAQPGWEKWRALLGADALVLPSRILSDGRCDSAPVTLVEAMTVGVPVVATAVGGIPALLEAGACGLLVPPEQPLALRAALQRLQQDAPLAARLRAAGRRRARDFSWDRVGARLRALLAAL